MAHVQVQAPASDHERIRARELDPMRAALLAIEAVVGVAALVCGPLLIATDDLGMQRSALDGSPFSSFVVPGLVLSAVVGGSLAGAAWTVWRRKAIAPLASICAGGILLGWIAAETVWISGGRGLQAIIFASAMAIIALGNRLRHRAA